MPQPNEKIVPVQSQFAIYTCNFNRFTARLTSRNLAIYQNNNIQSFALSDITGVTVFNNAPQHHRQVINYVKRRRQLYWFIITPAIALVINNLPLSLHTQQYAWLAAPFLSLLVCSFLPIAVPHMSMRCGLIIETTQHTYTFPFNSNDLSATELSRFLQQLKDHKAADNNY